MLPPTRQASLFKPTDPVAPARIPEQKVFQGVEFPLVLEPNLHPVEGVTCRPDGRCQIDALDEALDGWVEANHNLIDQLLLKVRRRPSVCPSVRPWPAGCCGWWCLWVPTANWPGGHARSAPIF